MESKPWDMGMSEEKFKQEYPAEIEESFQKEEWIESSGCVYKDLEVKHEMQDCCIEAGCGPEESFRSIDRFYVEPKKLRGFAAMSPERRKECASQGGLKAQALGVGHKFDPKEAAEAGRLGGIAKGRNRRAENVSGK